MYLKNTSDELARLTDALLAKYPEKRLKFNSKTEDETKTDHTGESDELLREIKVEDGPQAANG